MVFARQGLLLQVRQRHTQRRRRHRNHQNDKTTKEDQLLDQLHQSRSPKSIIVVTEENDVLHEAVSKLPKWVLWNLSPHIHHDLSTQQERVRCPRPARFSGWLSVLTAKKLSPPVFFCARRHRHLTHALGTYRTRRTHHAHCTQKISKGAFAVRAQLFKGGSRKEKEERRHE